MYDPRDIVKDFKLRAYPDACTGTPETIESYAREVARNRKRPSGGERLRLTPEPVPPGTPPGWRAFRFTHSKRVWLGTVCGVVYDQETDNTVFVMNDTPLAGLTTGPVSFTTRQDSGDLQESHILIPPNGYVSPELIVSDEKQCTETQRGTNA